MTPARILIAREGGHVKRRLLGSGRHAKAARRRALQAELTQLDRLFGSTVTS